MKKHNENSERIIIQLQTIRECKEMSQADLAKLTGTRQEVISRMESGKNIPSLETICHIANNLGYKLILKKMNKKEE